MFLSWSLTVDRFNLKFPSLRGSCRSWGILVLGYCGFWWTVWLFEPTRVRRVCYWCLHDLQCSLLRLARLSRDDQHRLEWSKPLAVCHCCKESVVAWIQSTIRSSNPRSRIWGPWENGREHFGEPRRCRVIEVDSADLNGLPSIVKETTSFEGASGWWECNLVTSRIRDFSLGSHPVCNNSWNCAASQNGVTSTKSSKLRFKLYSVKR